MTPDQIKLARHALGLPNDQRRSYRNRYFAAPKSPQREAWDDLVQRGLAQRGAGDSVQIYYRLTDAGARMAINPTESLDAEDFPRSNREAPHE